MKTLLLLFILLGSLSSQAQYYYNDIIGTQETNNLMKNYTANKVKTVSATGYDNRGVKATDFSELQEVKENGRLLRSSTINNFNKKTTYSRFDEKGRVTNITDSSAQIQGITTYLYDENNRISMVQNTVKDSASAFDHIETHQWFFNTAGKPEKMWRIISSTRSGTGADSLEVRFVTDEDGNIAEERTFRKGIETSYLYYYYDDKNRLLDIVRFNTRLKKLLPDIMFEYDVNDNVVQKTTTTSSLNIGYLIWRYIYD
ncbi:MAG TPA: hypothetical protein PKI55_14370, partial [Chitinophagaceae bacterium]|nr:hypothetical protein [Chitinophagaceae bacterium]